VIDDAKNAANKLWEDTKAGLTKVYDDAKGAMNSAVDSVLGFVKQVLDYLPKFRYAEIGNIYIKCLIDPLNCNILEAKLPSLEVCFSKIGCLKTGEMPTVAEFGTWFKENVLGKIKTWFENLIDWKSFTFNIPDCSNGCLTYKDQSFSYPKPELVYHSTSVFGHSVNVPYGFRFVSTHFATVKVPNGLHTKNVGLHYPGGFKLSSAKSEATSAEAQAATDQANTKSSERAQKTQNQNKQAALTRAAEEFKSAQEKQQEEAQRGVKEAQEKATAAKELSQKSDYNPPAPAPWHM